MNEDDWDPLTEELGPNFHKSYVDSYGLPNKDEDEEDFEEDYLNSQEDSEEDEEERETATT